MHVVAESDDLPTILPPKRRRQQVSSRSSTAAAAAAAEVAERAASSAAAAEVKVKLAMQNSLLDTHGSERIMREFPRHNWLEHKILQRKAYTPPATGTADTPPPPPPPHPPPLPPTAGEESLKVLTSSPTMPH